MLRGTMRTLFLPPLLLLLLWLAGCGKEQPPVTVQVQPYLRAEFSLKKPLAGTDAVSEMQAALYQQLTADLVFAAAPPQIIAAEESVTFCSEANDAAEAEQQVAAATRAMEQTFGKGSFTVPTTAKAFRNGDLGLQRETADVLAARLKNMEIKATVEPAGDGRVKITPSREVGDREMTALTTPGRLELWLLPKEITVNIDDNGIVTATQYGKKKITPAQVLQAGYFVLDGTSLKMDSAVTYSQSKPAIAFSVKPEAQSRLLQITSGHIGSQMMIVIDGKIIMSPVIRAQISDAGIIQGNFTKDEAEDLANLLNAGQLPAEVTVVDAP